MEKEYFCNHAGTEEDPCECKFEKEFNLSEKITDAVVGYERVSVATTKDVKEFIKILLQAEREGLNMKEVIEKNAGDKLLEKQGGEK